MKTVKTNRSYRYYYRHSAHIGVQFIFLISKAMSLRVSRSILPQSTPSLLIDTTNTLQVHLMMVTLAHKKNEKLLLIHILGKVFIYALYTPEIQEFNYKRPIKSVALDPDYARKSTHQFVSGGMAEQLVKRGGLGTRTLFFMQMKVRFTLFNGAPSSLPGQMIQVSRYMTRIHIYVSPISIDLQAVHALICTSAGYAGRMTRRY